MKVIIGLGNPDTKYQNTIHNVGRIYLDSLKDIMSSNGTQQSAWEQNSKLLSYISKVSYGLNDLLLVKPTTYMNNSGQAVSKIINYYNVFLSDVLVVHDDVDLNKNTYKLVYNSSSAGHHGIEDIFNHLHTQEFWRLRIGVGRPLNNKFDVHDYVLSSLSTEDKNYIFNLKIDPIKRFLDHSH